MSERFDRAIAAIDAANADDPATIVIDGTVRSKELAHAELMTDWVRRLDPAATEEQLLAARAHHLRRWTVPRSSYPEGRSGYLRWRRDLQRQHAAQVAEILAGVGYETASIERVQAIIRKERLASDAAVQTHEDALCLVFFQTQAVELAEQLGADKTVDVVDKTLRKMSPAGIDALLALDLPSGLRAMVMRAAEPPGGGVAKRGLRGRGTP
jgi:hypothetical protein